MKKKNGSTGLTIFSFILGFGFIALGLYLYFDFKGKNIDNPSETSGKVVRIHESKSSQIRPKIGMPDEYKSLLPVVEFTTSNGKKIEFTDNWAAEDDDFQYVPGQKVQVIYNTKSPEDATIKRKENIGMVHFFLIGLGIFILLLPKLRKIALE